MKHASETKKISKIWLTYYDYLFSSITKYNVSTNEKLTCHLEPRKHLFVRCLLDTARLNIRQFRHCPSYRPQTKVHNHLWSSRQSLSFRPSIAVQSYSWENMWVLLPELKTEKTKVRWEVSKKNEIRTTQLAFLIKLVKKVVQIPVVVLDSWTHPHGHWCCFWSSLSFHSLTPEEAKRCMPDTRQPLSAKARSRSLLCVRCCVFLLFSALKRRQSESERARSFRARPIALLPRFNSTVLNSIE